MKFLIVLAAFLVAANGQIIMQGRCADVNVQENFDIPAYTGLWYETYRYEQGDQFGADCTTARYTLVNGTVAVFNAQVLNGTSLTISGTAIPDPAANGTGKLLVNFPTAANVYSQYWVLKTDYTGFALVYSCTNLANNNRRLSSWILSRTPGLSPSAILEIDPVIRATSGLYWDVYRQTSQSESSCRSNANEELYY